MSQQQQPPRGRGGRGRARGTDQQAQVQRPGGGPPQHAGAAPRVAAPRPAWGPPVRAPGQPGMAPGPTQQGAVARVPSAPLGRVSSRVEGGVQERPGSSISMEGVVTGGGDGAASRTVGPTMRGRRNPVVVLNTRPPNMNTKKGTAGRPINLSANYFEVTKVTDWMLYQYRVDFAPEEDRLNIKKAYVRTALRDIVQNYLFDGTVMYTSNRLATDPLELFVEGEGEGERVRISIRMVGDVAPGDYHYLQIYNIVMRKCIQSMKLQLVGRNYYDAKCKVMLPDHKLELWPGYITSMRQQEHKILLNLEISFKVMRMDTVFQMLNECLQEDRANYKKLFTSKIIGMVVLTDYNNRTYRIDDVDWRTTPESKFPRADGSSISYMEYYKNRYQLAIRSPTQPMIVSRAKAREIRAGMAETIYLVPELCRLTGLTDFQRNDFRLMKALADHTRIGPANRIEKLQQYAKRVTETPQAVKELKAWDLQFANRIIEFAGRVMPPEKILLGNRQMCQTQDADWTRELRSREMFAASEVNAWAVVFPKRLGHQVESFTGLVRQAAKGMRWNLPVPDKYDIPDDRPATYLPALDRVIHGPRGEPNLIMCVVSNNKADRYSAIKKKCCVDKAVPTQVMVARNLDAKGAMSIATKVAIQMNCKMGGAPWSVEMPVSGLMVVGYDVCHDTQNKSISFGAMVASLDKQCTRFYSVPSAHKSSEELSNDLGFQIVAACKIYLKENGCLPEKIIIYRDGVGEGQLEYVYNHEVESIRAKLEALYPNGSLRMAFVVVTKRLNTRIFAGGQNPPPGTVVDDVITLPQSYDFYIVSQCVKQGTVSPTCYNIIFDTLKLAPDHMQRLTYKLCHLYFNWSGTVRVPAPCQYAHKLAFLVSQYLHREPNRDLNTVLYYL